MVAVQVAPNSVASNNMHLLPYSLEGRGQTRVSGSDSQGAGRLVPAEGFWLFPGFPNS